jgi:hypothetical protein
MVTSLTSPLKAVLPFLGRSAEPHPFWGESLANKEVRHSKEVLEAVLKNRSTPTQTKRLFHDIHEGRVESRFLSKKGGAELAWGLAWCVDFVMNKELKVNFWVSKLTALGAGLIVLQPAEEAAYKLGRYFFRKKQGQQLNAKRKELNLIS